MLKKLLKYDLKWCYKPLIVFYLLAVFFAMLVRILEQWNQSLIFLVLRKICIGVEIAMLINVLINNFMRIWARFIRNIYKDESYLTHTLPVQKGTIYGAKILAAIITMLTSAVVIVLCITISHFSEENWQFLKASMEQTAIYFDSTIFSFVSVLIVTIFFEMLFAVFAGYLGIILGYRANYLKIVKSILIGFVAYMIPSVLTIRRNLCSRMLESRSDEIV